MVIIQASDTQPLQSGGWGWWLTATVSDRAFYRVQDTCAHPDCEVEFDVTEAVRGSYCSEACYYRHHGEKILRKLETDHRYCASCGRKLKDIEPSTDDAPDAFIGYQYQTGNAEFGEKTRFNPQLTDGGEKQAVDSTGVVCAECGATNSNDDYMREFHYKDFVIELISFVRDQQQAGAIENEFNWRDYVKDVRDGHTVEYSLGKHLVG